MKPTKHKDIRGAEGGVLGALIGVVLLVLLAVSLYFNLDRSRQIEEKEVLQTRLTEAQGRIQELEEDLNAESSAREAAAAQVETAKAAERKAREEHAQQQQKALETAQQLEQQLLDYEQRLAAAEEGRTNAESQLAREVSRREAAEQQVAAAQAAQAEVEAAAAESAPQPEGLNAQQAQAGTPAEPQAMEAPRPAPPPTRGEAEAPADPVAGADPPARSTPARGAEDAVRLDESDVASATTEDPVYDTAPNPIRRGAPDYPYNLKRAGVEGSVVLSFSIDTNGRVQDVEIEESSHPAFSESAIAAVRRWRFEPARLNGQPVVARISQRLDFSIN